MQHVILKIIFPSTLNLPYKWIPIPPAQLACKALISQAWKFTVLVKSQWWTQAPLLLHAIHVSLSLFQAALLCFTCLFFTWSEASTVNQPLQGRQVLTSGRVCSSVYEVIYRPSARGHDCSADFLFASECDASSLQAHSEWSRISKLEEDWHCLLGLCSRHKVALGRHAVAGLLPSVYSYLCLRLTSDTNRLNITSLVLSYDGIIRWLRWHTFISLSVSAFVHFVDFAFPFT